MKLPLHKSKLSLLLLLISLLLLIYVLYRNFIYYPESTIQHYAEYYFLIFFLILFSLISFLLSKELKLNLLLVVFSVLITSYLFEFYLNYFDQTWKKMYSNEGETKYEIMLKENISKNKIFTPLNPMVIKINNNKILTMSGIPNVNNIHCNEIGYFSRYKSDKFGFNNPNNQIWENKEIEYLVVGDSYAHGNCVNEEDTIAGQLKKISNKSLINIGYGGSGPLLEYARLREYFPDSKVKNILWFFCGANDLMDLKIELSQKILRKYLENEEFSQNLKRERKSIDNELRIFHDKFFNRYKKENLVINFLKLQRLRWYILYYLPKNYDYDEFEEIMKQVKHFTEINNSKLHFVFIPSDTIIHTKTMFKKERNKVIKIINDLNIPIIDIYDIVFKNLDDPLPFLPPNKKGHFNPRGNLEVAKAIFENLN